MAAATLATALSEVRISSQKPIFQDFVGAANTMDNSGVQDIFQLETEGMTRIAVKLTVGTNALAAFVIQAKFRADDTAWTTLRSTTAQYTAPNGILVETSGDLSLLAVGTGYFIMDVAGIARLKLQANSSAAGGSTLAINGGAV